MRYRKLDPENDYTFGNSAQDFYVNVPNTVGQAVETALMLWLGEWYLDTSLGVPYIQGVLGKHTKGVADGTIQNQVTEVQGVVNIESYASQIDDVARTMDVQLTVNTIFGPTPVDIENFTLY